MGHDHHHDHRAAPGGERRLATMLGLVLVYIGVEIAGGLWSGSLALLADAGHMLSDAAALAITLFALRIARRPATAERTFGWHRAEILAAVINASTLIVIAFGILWEAWGRWADPPPIAAPAMIGIAAGGLAVNLVGLAMLRRDSANLSMRAAWLHVLSDAMGSAAAIVGGVCVWLWDWRAADPLASAAIAVLILRSSWRLLDEATHVLMEGAPAHIDVNAVRTALRATPGVLDVHDLHVWTITSGMPSASVHVVTDEGRVAHEMVRTLAAVLRARFGIAHATIQVEPPDFAEAEEFHP